MSGKKIAFVITVVAFMAVVADDISQRVALADANEKVKQAVDTSSPLSEIAHTLFNKALARLSAAKIALDEDATNLKKAQTNAEVSELQRIELSFSLDRSAAAVRELHDTVEDMAQITANLDSHVASTKILTYPNSVAHSIACSDAAGDVYSSSITASQSACDKVMR